MSDGLNTYKSTLTGPELDAALRNIGNIQPNIEKAAAYAETAEQYGTIVQQNQTAIQAIEANLPAVQGAAANAQSAAANAQAAAQSAQEAQTAAQQALGFRTFFSAVSPDENGDLDPSRPMTTPTAQASWTIKSKGDRIQSVQVTGPAGIRLTEFTLDGSAVYSDITVRTNTLSFNTKPQGVNPVVAVGYCEVLELISGDTRDIPHWFPSPANKFLYFYFPVDYFGGKTDKPSIVAALNAKPIKCWYQDAGGSGSLYVPIQSQGHEYRCKMLELTAGLDAGNNVQSNVPSRCDVKYELTGGESYIKYQNGIAFSRVFSGTLNNPKAYCTDFYQIGVGNKQQGSFWFGYADTFVYCFINPEGAATTDEQVQAFKSNAQARYAAGNPITFWYRSTAYTEANDLFVSLETHANNHVYAHDPVELVAVPYTDSDVTAANQLAAMPSTLPYFDSADVPMLLDSIGMPEPDVTVQSDGTLDAENTQKAAEWVQETAQRLMAAPLASAPPVAGTYVVSSQDGTTVLVSLKAMQDGGDAATLEGMTLDDIKALISSMIADANK